METVYVSEHCDCYNYQKGDRPGIESRSKAGGEEWLIRTYDDEIIFVTEGRLHLFCQGRPTVAVPQGHMLLIPSGKQVKALAVRGVHLTVLRFRMQLNMCERFSLDRITDRVAEQAGKFTLLPIRGGLWNYLDALEVYLRDGVRCTHFFNLKLREAFMLLRAYYSREDLFAFLFPLLQDESEFADAILRHYRTVKNVAMLAQLSNYSLSGFEKRFRKVFGMPAGRWIKQQRTKEIFREITHSGKTFKEISGEFGFYSPAHFNTFCKTQFGAPPGDIRRQGRK
ncbi:MAG: AraC family transcriptional regulator [Bacteroides sp.]|nr:AraC family transcriptional regulator [Bacteroides sp.]